MDPKSDASPRLSVVVPFVNAWSDLEGCLVALAAQDVALEVIVAERHGGGMAERIRTRFPDAVVLSAAPGTTIPDLRALAFDAARAPDVAVIEDHVIVPQGWARRLLEERARGSRVVGGAVENVATDSWVDEAAFLCEYSHLLPPIPGGPVDGVTGNNTVYDRALLEQHRDVTHAGLWENHLHDAIRAGGVALVCRPDIVVGHKMHYSVGLYLSQRYLYSRSYSGARARGASLPRRLALGAASMALPPVLLYRIVRRCLDKNVDRALLLRSLPLLALFVCGWAWGDVVGSWFGPGDALSRIR